MLKGITDSYHTVSDLVQVTTEHVLPADMYSCRVVMKLMMCLDVLLEGLVMVMMSLLLL